MTEVIGRATVEMDLTGNIEQGINRVIAALGRMEDALGKMGRGPATLGPATAITNIGDKFDNFMGSFQNGMRAMGVFAVREIGQMISGAGRQLQDFGAGIVATIASVAGGIFQQGIALQSAEAGFARVFGDQADEMLRKSGEVAKTTSFLTSQVETMALLVGRAGADPFQNVLASVTDPETGRRTQEQITALEALNDLASLRPGTDSMDRLMVSLQNFLGGTTAKSAVTSLRRVFDLPIEAVREFEAAFENSTTTAERFAGFAEVAARNFGGIGRSMAGTMGFMLNQFEDIQELLFRLIGRAAVDVFTPIVQDVQDFLSGLLEAEQESGDFGKAFTAIAEAVAAVVRPLIEMVKIAIEFAAANPTIIKWVTLFSLLSGILLFLGGTVLVGLVSGVTALAGALVAITAALSFVPTLIVLIELLPLILPLILAISAAFAIWDQDLFGLKTLVDNFILVIRALFEGLSNLDDLMRGRISRDLADQLEQAGLTQVVLDIGGAFVRMKAAAEAAWEGISRGLTVLWTRVRPVLASIFGFGDETEDGASKAMKTQGAVGGLIETINSISVEQWEAFGEAIGDIVADFLTSMETVRDIINFIRIAAMVLKFVFAPLIAMFLIFKTVLTTVFEILARITAIPIFAQAFSALTGIDFTGGTSLTTDKSKQAFGNTLVDRGQVKTAQDEQSNKIKFQEANTLATILGRTGKTDTEGPGSKTIVKVMVDGRMIAEAIGEAEDDENIRLGVGS